MIDATYCQCSVCIRRRAIALALTEHYQLPRDREGGRSTDGPGPAWVTTWNGDFDNGY